MATLVLSSAFAAGRRLHPTPARGSMAVRIADTETGELTGVALDHLGAMLAGAGVPTDTLLDRPHRWGWLASWGRIPEGMPPCDCKLPAMPVDVILVHLADDHSGDMPGAIGGRAVWDWLRSHAL